MLQKTKILALAMAVVMLFSACAMGEGGSVYLTLSDPYFTDGTNTYDFTGLTVQAKLSGDESFTQLLLSVLTSAGGANAAVELTGEGLNLYGDGFTAAYSMTMEDLSQMLATLVGKQPDLSSIAPGNFSFDNIHQKVEAAENMSLQETIAGLYAQMSASVTADALASGNTVSVNTITQDDVTAVAIPFEYTAEALDAILGQTFQMIDNTGAYQMLVGQMASQLGDAAAQLPASCMEVYTTYIQPLQISMDGTEYFSENDIYMELNVYSKGVIVTPLAFEIVNEETAGIYMNGSFTKRDAAVATGAEAESVNTLYLAMEANNGDYDEYVEFGALEGETPVFTMVYTKGQDAETGADAYEVYAGIAEGEQVYEISGAYSTDKTSFRKLWASINVSGMQAELRYDGAIAMNDGAHDETGTLTLASNNGNAGHIGVAFGCGANDAVSIIPADGSVPSINLAAATEEESAQLSVDLQTLVSNVMVYMVSGVPGFAQYLAIMSSATTTTAPTAVGNAA